MNETYEEYLKRLSAYKEFGYDIEKERRFFFDKIQPLSGNILEVGTGKGHLALELARQGYHFVTVDINEDAQAQAKKYLEHFNLVDKVDFYLENAESLSFPDNSFDTVVSLNTVHHLVNPFLVMDEIIRVLKETGKILLSEFSKKGLEIIEKIHQREGGSHHLYRAGLEGVQGYLAKKGFVTEAFGSQFQEILTANR
ncbi:MAG: methyltransferase domain-containing protein [Candidatus Omnitrophica bacterium]|nr:methyltransferase domain-containing protein [Candidatus Omnitrophota bacterium]MDD5429489.1 methyltransferase domain-containing protein [Candidatus Omnitrophota bacterium]